jgi:ATPase subunit of ABC transporter with duplicated ATPase domains
MPMSEYAIKTTKLTKRFGEQIAVDCVNMHVPQGKIYGLLGRNGAGKTTTMRMLLNLAAPTSGEILLFGKDSDKVLEINLNSDKYQTWLGDKIGATADEVLTKYRKEFTEPESIHTNEKLEGWFDLGDGVLIIFDFDKDDEMIVNTEISSDSKVELIKLTNMMYMD